MTSRSILKGVLAAGCGLGIAVAVGWTKLPYQEFDDLQTSRPGSDYRVLDRQGVIIHETRRSSVHRQLPWISLAEFSPTIIEAVLAAEDKRFFRHPGVDPLAVVSSLIGYATGQPLRGASTLTMQLVRLMEPRLRGTDSKWAAKFVQAVAGIKLNFHWTKEQQLEAYLNLVPLRGEWVGMPAAMEAMFHKSPEAANFVEAEILAAMIRSPNVPVDQLSQRSCRLAQELERSDDCRRIRTRLGKLRDDGYEIRQPKKAPHFARRFVGDDPTYLSTLDGQLQEKVRQVVASRLANVVDRNARDAAVLVLENRSGEVLAYLGSSGLLSHAAAVDGVTGRRQAGSTLKPFLYAMGLERRLITPATLLSDRPYRRHEALGIYQPQNYDRRFRGPVSVRTALASSLNIPAVRLAEMIGIGPFVQKLRELGFDDLESSEYYGPSLALGAAEISLWQLSNAYRTLANAGVHSPLVVRRDQPAGDSRELFSPATAYLVGHILADREARALTFGLENHLSTRFWTAVKTGTSKDMRDNWCVGYSQHYTVGVWVGNFSGAPMWDVSGIDGAAPIWSNVMQFLQRNRTSEAPPMPPGVVKHRVTDRVRGTDSQEVFLAGTSIKEVESAGDVHPRILYPPDGAVLALDPQMPPDRQRVFLKASSQDMTGNWIVDGQTLTADSFELATLEEGSHRVELRSRDGAILDATIFYLKASH